VAWDEGLAERVRVAVAFAPGLDERKMFGAWAIFHRGNLACAVSGEALIVRVGPDAYEDALAEPHTDAFSPGGRSMRGLVAVDASGLEEDADLEAWVHRGLAFAASLPPK
jgi:TfoX/Sxy family transcriptional regulator of competence genes